MDFEDFTTGTTYTAWDLIGYDGPLWLQIEGGRTKYDQAVFNDNTWRLSRPA